MLSSGSGTPRGNAGMPPASRPRRRRLRAILLVTGLAVAMFGVGFFWFVRQMPAAEAAPPRMADGIVVLTGSAFRIGDALDLLASRHGRRLLITGVHPAT